MRHSWPPEAPLHYSRFSDGPRPRASNRQRVVVAAAPLISLPHLFQHSDAFLESPIPLSISASIRFLTLFKKPIGGSGGAAPKSCGGGDLAAVVARSFPASPNASRKWSLLLIPRIGDRWRGGGGGMNY